MGTPKMFPDRGRRSEESATRSAKGAEGAPLRSGGQEGEVSLLLCGCFLESLELAPL